MSGNKHICSYSVSNSDRSVFLKSEKVKIYTHDHLSFSSSLHLLFNSLVSMIILLPCAYLSSQGERVIITKRLLS